MTAPPISLAPALSNGGSSSGSSSSDRTVDDKPREVKRQRTPRKLAAASSGQLASGAARQDPPERTCRVPGCTAELAAGYNQKYRICSAHYAAPVITVGADLCRFCQQCSKIHAVEEFDTDRRSCRASLERHQQARTLRKRRSQSRHSPPSQRSSQRQRRAQLAPLQGEQQPEAQRAAQEQPEQHGLRPKGQTEPQSLQAQQRELRQQAGPHLLQAVGMAALQPSPLQSLRHGSQDITAGAAPLSARESSSNAGVLEHEQQQQQQNQAAAMSPWMHSPMSAPGAPPPPASLAAMSAAHRSGSLPLQAELQHQLLQLQQAVLQWEAADMPNEQQPQAGGRPLPPPAASASLQLGTRCWQEASLLQHAMLWSASPVPRGGPLGAARAPRREMVQQAIDLLQLDMPLSDYVPSERELEQLSHQLGHRQWPPARATAAMLGAGRALPLPPVHGPGRQDPAALGSLAAPAAAVLTAAVAAQPEVLAPLARLPADTLAASGSAASASLPAPELPASACTASTLAAALPEVEVGILPPQHAQQARHAQQLLGSSAPASRLALPPLPTLSAASAVPLPAGAPLTGPEAADWLSQFLL